MKKKIKDLTLEEILKYCEKTSCEDCIFWKFSLDCEVNFIRNHYIRELELEIEVEE